MLAGEGGSGLCGQWDVGVEDSKSTWLQVWGEGEAGTWAEELGMELFHSLVWISWCLTNLDRWLNAFPQAEQS